jgi:hypothetical protein
VYGCRAPTWSETLMHSMSVDRHLGCPYSVNRETQMHCCSAVLAAEQGAHTTTQYILFHLTTMQVPFEGLLSSWLRLRCSFQSVQIKVGWGIGMAGDRCHPIQWGQLRVRRIWLATPLAPQCVEKRQLPLRGSLSSIIHDARRLPSSSSSFSCFFLRLPEPSSTRWEQPPS